MVDFLIHILLRYYEATPGKSRDERVKETLETMGVSILVGGLTTFLATVPLAFSSAEVFKTVFYSFFAMVTLGKSSCNILLRLRYCQTSFPNTYFIPSPLGVTHGLILLPVLLSYFGPTVSVSGHSHHTEEAGEVESFESEAAKEMVVIEDLTIQPTRICGSSSNGSQSEVSITTCQSQGEVIAYEKEANC